LTHDVILAPDTAVYDGQVELLYARAFGPGRFAKAAARLRERNQCLRAYSILALRGDAVIGACRIWPIKVGDAEQALFLGPIAVDPARQSGGLGQRLVAGCLDAIDRAQDQRAIILVGDLAYFGKMGFEHVPAGDVVLPGPADPARILWRKSPFGGVIPKGRLSVPPATSQID
jgi:predicted N-acetyltransferase YhbS